MLRGSVPVQLRQAVDIQPGLLVCVLGAIFFPGLQLHITSPLS